MLVTSREHQGMQCSLLVQQALGRLDQPRQTSSSSRSSVSPTPDPNLDTEAVASTVHKAFNRYAENLTLCGTNRRDTKKRTAHHRLQNVT